MPNLPFTLRQLDVFENLSSTGSFTRCAEELGISQASVSSQIKSLEDQLGISLFARRPGQSPTLTADGMRFLADFTEFRSAANRLARHRRQVPHFDEPVTFRVRAGQGLIDHYIRHALGAFVAANPMIELDFDAQPPSSSLAQEMQSGRIDFGLFHIPMAMDVPGHLRSLARVAGGVYGHRSFAEGDHGRLDAEAISQLPFIMPVAGSRPEKQALLAMKEFGIVPRLVVGHSQYFDVMAVLLAQRVGVASFSAAILPRALRDEVVMLHQLHDWRLVFYRKDSADPRFDLVEDFLLESVLGNPDYPTIERHWR